MRSARISWREAEAGKEPIDRRKELEVRMIGLSRTRRHHVEGVAFARVSFLLILTTVAALLVGTNIGAARSRTHAQTTLNFMSLANSPGVEAAWSDLIAAYEKANPGVKINRTAVPYANYRTSVKLHASASDAPDLVEGDMGPGGVMSSLVPGGLLLPLDKYSTKYGWPAKFGTFIDQLRLAKDGKHVGVGSVYGIPDFAELLGIFYNKSLMQKLQLKAPTTFAAFAASLATAKAGGVTHS